MDKVDSEEMIMYLLGSLRRDARTALLSHGMGVLGASSYREQHRGSRLQ